jgi:phosphoglycolate phosphatase
MPPRTPEKAAGGAAGDAGAVLFDLDGTFADTAPDMARALNLQLARHGRDPLPFEDIRPQVSNGARAMIRIGFGLGPGDAGYDALRREYLAVYADHLALETALFPGMTELIGVLEGRRIPWGIVTNKPSWLTDPLMAALGLAQRAACIVSGDTAARPKPHPDPILYACDLIGLPPRDCCYVGDAQRDVAAGLAAGTATLAALFGYIREGDDPGSWGAHGLIRNPLEILDWVAPDAARPGHTRPPRRPRPAPERPGGG